MRACLRVVHRCGRHRHPRRGRRADDGLGAGRVEGAGRGQDREEPVKGVGNAKKNIETNCVTCHGPGVQGRRSGRGRAAAAEARGLDLCAKVAAETDGEIFWKISNGRGAMPPWKHLPDKDRWEIVNYLRTLQNK